MNKLDEIELLATLVGIDSSNPGPGETEMAEFLEDLAIENGFEVKKFEKKVGRSNLIITVDAGKGAALGFSGHLDTKPIGDASALWNTKPWEFTVDGDLGYGLGTSDMKAGLAAMFVAATRWSKVAQSGQLRLIFTADEESGSIYGSQYLGSEVQLNVDEILVGEPSGVKLPWEAIHTISRGISCFEIIIKGLQGHSGLSETLPTSATIGAAKVLLALADIDLSSISDRKARGKPTLNMGVTLGGGVTYGVHPGEARFKCDVRLIPNMKKEDLESLINIALTTTLPGDLEWEIRWEEGIGWMEAVQIPDSSKLVKVTQAVARERLGREVPLGCYPGGTDASNFFLRGGIPALASFGPGWLSVAHGPNERVGISQVREATDMYTMIAERYLNSGSA